MTGPALNLVVLRSSDLDRATAFYSALGLVFQRHQHGPCPMHLSAEFAGAVFELYPESDASASTRGTRIGFSVPHLDAVIASLSAFAGAIVSPPKNSPWGRRAVVTDPDGHRVELIEITPGSAQ